MQIDIPHPPNTKAWYWGPGNLGKDPIEVEIDTVNIWLENEKILITYSFKEENMISIFGRHDGVFATFEEANEFKRKQVKLMRDSLSQ